MDNLVVESRMKSDLLILAMVLVAMLMVGCRTTEPDPNYEYLLGYRHAVAVIMAGNDGKLVDYRMPDRNRVAYRAGYEKGFREAAELLKDEIKEQAEREKRISELCLRVMGASLEDRAKLNALLEKMKSTEE